ncbi:hypothetical protein [Arenicella sp. 4NH20-0111]|uniref:hypothetical protein n=1 Tax=Arenicella sp. 4NH20-0111 TaxID=3127648 RepID=UPI00333E38C2
MIKQYAKFFLNGIAISIIAWLLQQFLYRVMPQGSGHYYALASVLTLIPIIGLNFLIQSKFIFNEAGQVKRFIVADIAILALVTALSPICRLLIDVLLGAPWGTQLGFISAAFIASIPSFIIRRYWVFSSPVR